MDAATPEQLPSTMQLIPKPARRVTFKMERLFDSVAARKFYDSNATVPPKKRFRGFFAIVDPKSETKRRKVLSLSPPAENKHKKRPLTKELVKEERPLPEALAEKIRKMGGERVQLVIQKQLRYTDVTIRYSRLSIPGTMMKTNAEFLSNTEKEILSEQAEDTGSRTGIKVLVIDPRLERKNLCLKRWKMTSTFIYNLTENWNSLVEENALEAGDTIQLWAFRVEERARIGLSDLCFALVKLELVNNGGGDAVHD